jgi:hypothetical protein
MALAAGTASSGPLHQKELAAMRGARWIVGLGALVVALVAIYVLFWGGEAPMPERSERAMDDIDEESREAMRELLREVGKE